jgi:glycerate 2-kinase
MILATPDSLTGTLRATEVAAAIGRGLESAGLEADLCPVADGGEGTLEVLLTALGGEAVSADAHDPLGAPIRAGFALVEDGGTAIVETAAASGIQFGTSDPWSASTYGTGELIAAAVDAGAQVVLLGVGGSATTDGGAGAVAAIRERGGLRGARLVVLCDVRTSWERCAEVFGPQKGADPDMVVRLAERLRGLDLPREVPMSGAAGGLAGGLLAAFGARLEPGAPFVLDVLDFDRRMRAARAVITGEGRIDEQTLQGKVVGEIGTRTRQAGVPLHAIVGSNALGGFEARMIDLQQVREASTRDEIEASAHELGALIRTGRA